MDRRQDGARPGAPGARHPRRLRRALRAGGCRPAAGGGAGGRRCRGRRHLHLDAQPGRGRAPPFPLRLPPRPQRRAGDPRRAGGGAAAPALRRGGVDRPQRAERGGRRVDRPGRRRRRPRGGAGLVRAHPVRRRPRLGGGGGGGRPGPGLPRLRRDRPGPPAAEGADGFRRARGRCRAGARGHRAVHGRRAGAGDRGRVPAAPRRRPGRRFGAAAVAVAGRLACPGRALGAAGRAAGLRGRPSGRRRRARLRPEPLLRSPRPDSRGAAAGPLLRRRGGGGRRLPPPRPRPPRRGQAPDGRDRRRDPAGRAPRRPLLRGRQPAARPEPLPAGDGGLRPARRPGGHPAALRRRLLRRGRPARPGPGRVGVAAGQPLARRRRRAPRLRPARRHRRPRHRLAVPRRRRLPRPAPGLGGRGARRSGVVPAPQGPLRRPLRRRRHRRPAGRSGRPGPGRRLPGPAAVAGGRAAAHQRAGLVRRGRPGLRQRRHSAPARQGVDHPRLGARGAGGHRPVEAARPPRAQVVRVGAVRRGDGPAGRQPGAARLLPAVGLPILNWLAYTYLVPARRCSARRRSSAGTRSSGGGRPKRRSTPPASLWAPCSARWPPSWWCSSGSI